MTNEQKPQEPLWKTLGLDAKEVEKPDHLFMEFRHNFGGPYGPGSSRWIFRGETVREKLKTTLERAIEDEGADMKRALEIEGRFLREFKRRAHHYISDAPADYDLLEWWALMQHFGAPTRLLDWTYSPYAALYFALNRKIGPNPDGTDPNPAYLLWVVDANWIARRAKECLNRDSDHEDIFKQDGSEFAARRVAAFLTKSHLLPDPIPPLVYPVNPFRLNERLTIQRGLFLCASDIRESFVENFKAVEPTYPDAYVYIIDPKHRRGLLDELDRMNMNSATLFPGLEGFSKSLWTKRIIFDGNGL